MKTKHTPGPWDEPKLMNYGRLPHHFEISATSSDCWIAKVQFMQERKEETRANANLMVTAPELLEALQDVLNMCNDAIERGLEFDSSEVKRNIESVIQKATE